MCFSELLQILKASPILKKKMSGELHDITESSGRLFFHYLCLRQPNPGSSLPSVFPVSALKQISPICRVTLQGREELQLPTSKMPSGAARNSSLLSMLANINSAFSLLAYHSLPNHEIVLHRAHHILFSLYFLFPRKFYPHSQFQLNLYANDSDSTPDSQLLTQNLYFHVLNTSQTHRVQD